MKKELLVAGLMSGTSADGIDVALLAISGRGWTTAPRLLHFASFPYSKRERERILRAANASSISVAELARLNFWLGYRLGEAVIKACRGARLPVRRLDLIASHGQTIYHQAEKAKYLGRAIATTWQIGEPACIAERTGAATIADFRVADVAAGGEGAPLAPYLDYVLLRSQRDNIVALNIGGIANVTLLPAGAGINEVIAFDTGPGNMVIDQLAARASGGRERLDREGRLAAQGQVIEPVFQKLLEHPYYLRRPPKTAGREQYGSDFVERLLKLSKGRDWADVIATATALTAETIVMGAASGSRLLGRERSQWKVIASGGGVHNRTLMRMLSERLGGAELRISDELGIPADAKEAVAFAVLGYATLQGEPANVIGATGARHPAILGKLSLPPPASKIFTAQHAKHAKKKRQ